MTAGILLFAAKRGIFDTLAANMPEDVQVSYRFPTNLERMSVYGAAARMVRQQGAAEWDSISVEAVTVDIWVRVVDLTGDVRAADEKCEAIAGVICSILANHRAIGNGLTYSDIVYGLSPEAIATPTPEPTITARLQLQALVQGIQV